MLSLRRWWWVFLWFLIVGSHGQSSTTPSGSPCRRTETNQNLLFSCPTGATIDAFDIDNLTVNAIETLQVTGENGDPGPLRSIPENICLFTQLKGLNLSRNQIRDASFRFTPSCLSQLESLDLNSNNLTELPVLWLSQMPKLRIINLARNQLTNIPSQMFSNISNIEDFDVYSNHITTFELWLVQIKTRISYLNNPVVRFTNQYNVDLSDYHSNITPTILLSTTGFQISFDDGLFEMYNRCNEITSNAESIVKQAIAIIEENNPGLLNWTCSCEQYYLREFVVSRTTNFSTWECSSGSGVIYPEMCRYRSSFSGTDVQPPLCKIYPSPDDFLVNTSNLEEIALKLYEKLSNITVLNSVFVQPFAMIIDQSERKFQSDIVLSITESVQNYFQLIISHIEDLISRITNPIDFDFGSVAILSVQKDRAIRSYSQIRQNQTSFNYSKEGFDSQSSTTTITIDSQSIDNLSSSDIYTFYYLPTSYFQFAQIDQNIRIIPPIVGVHLPTNSSRSITISFTDTPRTFGRYSCVFWQHNRWNDSGCSHSMDSNSTRHLCVCNHTTLFTLIFIPDKTIHQTYIPSIVIAILSIVCFCISIVLSIYRQATSFRHLSMANIFNLINSILLFVLLTVIFIQGYRSNEKLNQRCSKSQENLVLTTYFFLISTFASKTFLGIGYFLTIFFHFIFIQFAAMSNRWLYSGFLLVILIALIPTMIIYSILKQWKDFLVQYQGICWLNSSVIFRFVSIPMIIFLGLNALIISGITIHLLKFSCQRKAVETNEKRMIISMMIWLALCVSLGIAWIFGPLLDVLITENQQTSSVIKLWFFGIFIGLEGVWVLVVNMIFYANQKKNKKNRPIFSKKNKS